MPPVEYLADPLAHYGVAASMIAPCNALVMDSDSKRNLYLLSAFCAFGLVLCQDDIHLVCSPELWIFGKNAKLQCSMLKSSYPSKCVTSRTNTTVFRRTFDGIVKDECTLSDILGSCTSSGSCRCDNSPGNTTHYNFVYEFKAASDRDGYWECAVPCFNLFTPLKSSTSDCDNRRTFEETVIPILAYIIGLAITSPVSGCWTIAFLVAVVAFFIRRQTSVICVHPKTENHKDILQDRRTIIKIHNFIQKEVKCCCCCALNVEVKAGDPESGHVLITLKYRILWFYCLPDMQAKVEEFIKTDVIYGGLNEPAVDYPPGPPMSQPKHTGNGNGQSKKSKSDKAIPLSSVGRSSPPSETSGDEKTHMIPEKTGRALPVPANQPELTSIGIGNSASQRLEPLKTDRSKMPSVERNSGAFSRDLPSPRQQPLEPIPSGKKG